MAPLTQTKDSVALAGPRFDLDIGNWLRTTIFNSTWNIIFAVVLIIASILTIRAGYTAAPVSLSFNLAPNGVPTGVGSLILVLTNAILITSIVVILWFVGAAAVAYSAGRHHWPGPTQWLKDSLYNGAFGALVTLVLTIVIIFAIRGLLSWAVFGAEFRSDPEQVALLKSDTPGAIWGVVLANVKLFAIFRYSTVGTEAVIWRVWASLGVVLGLAALSAGAWGFGSPLKRMRTALVWLWLLSSVVIFFLLQGVTGLDTGPVQEVPTSRWGGLLLTIILSVVGIVVSFPIGMIMALGRRSEVRGVPILWAWGAGLLLIYWGLGGYPSEAVTLNVPLLFRDPPIWIVTLSPVSFAALQAIIIIGIFWAISFYNQGNMIKTFSVLYIELIRGVPLITVLFMANVMLPLFLPKGLEIDNLLRVVVGIILFTGAYMAENIRGGLQAIPNGQYEAAMAVGLSTAQSMRLIILPQALRLVIPAIVGSFISLFKDTSLVAIVGLFDLLRVAQVVVAQPDWLALQTESYAFVALVFWIFAFAMSRASQRLERNLGVGQY
jgi:general L-amino acid transport system permease protein